MFLLKGFSLIGIAGMLAFVVLGREPGVDGKPTYCSHTREIPFIADLPCESVDLAIYFVAFACVIAVLAFALAGIRNN